MGSKLRLHGGDRRRRWWLLPCALYAATAAAVDTTVPPAVTTMLANGSGAETIAQRLKQEAPAATAISLAAVYQRALQHNLQWQAQQAYRQAAQAGVSLAHGAFDTRFALRAGHTESHYFERSAMITRPRETETLYESGIPYPSEDVGGPTAGEEQDAVNSQDAEQRNQQRLACVVVDGIVVNPEYCRMETQVLPEREYASFKSSFAPVTNAFALEALQVLPWGGSVSAQLQSTRRIKSGYITLDRLERVDGTHNDPIGNGSTYPWTSAFLFSFNTPLPYARNAGYQSFGPQVNTEVAALDASIGDLRLQQQGDVTLAQVDAAYWDMVAGQYAYVIAGRHQAAADELAQRGRRLFSAGSITSYEMAQLDAELEQAKIAAEIAWQRFLAAAHALAEQLDLEPAAVPYSNLEVKNLLVSELPRDITPQDAMERNPLVAIAALELEKSRLMNRFHGSQLRPEVSLEFNLSYSQSDLVFGYKTWNDSYEHVFEPDRRERYVGLSYRYTFGQKAEKAAWSRSRSEVQQADLRLAQARSQASLEINEAQAARASVDSQLLQRRTGLEMAQAAYERSGRLREQNLLSEFERLRALQNLYRAAEEYLSAAVDFQRDRARMLAAAGGLYRWYQARGAKGKP